MGQNSFKDSFVMRKIHEEISQSHPVRKHLYRKFEKLQGVPLVSLVTSFVNPAMISISDAQMLESVLRECDLSNGLALLIHSPGGDLLAAERIINVCRSQSGTGEYIAVVPSMAKSAASLICLGASKILMSRTSELGPVDPQLIKWENGMPKVFSVPTLVSSYDHLFSEAVKTNGRIEPFLQQLANYDEREIAELRHICELMEEIAVRTLETGMLSKIDKDEITKKIQMFLRPERSKSHERPIRIDDATECGLCIEAMDFNSELWNIVYELGIRLDYFVSRNDVLKCIESSEISWYTSIQTDEE